MREQKAFVFDLYGTLLELGPQKIHRALPRALGIRPADWLRLVRSDLLTTSFETDESMASFICSRLAPGDPRLESECLRIIAEEKISIRAVEGAASLLGFLKRRGFRLGLISNLSSSYKSAVWELGLAEYFDALTFSCDEGMAKPDPAIYRATCDRMGVDPGAALMIGDSLPLDVDGARAAGMRALLLGAEPIPGLMDLALLDLDALFEEKHVRLTGSTRIDEVVADDDQGRYNLVWRGADDSGSVTYVKRYMLPESAWVEALAWEMYSLVGLERCHARVGEAGEPVLMVSQAAGAKYESVPVTAALAHELGRHFAFAYVFSNADIRPRNAFLCDGESERPIVTMIDLEHCFFDLAIDVEGLSDALDPGVIDATPDLEARVKKRVLTDRAMRRARRTFIEEEHVGEQVMDAFRAGFHELHATARERQHAILERLHARVDTPPAIVVGTHGWRRAFAHVDVNAIEARINESTDSVLARFC